MIENVKYYILDPINNSYSGISVYTKMLEKYISENFDVNCKRLAIQKNENIEAFYKYVFNKIINRNVTNINEKIIIEIPDSYCYLFDTIDTLSNNLIIHVRLHGLDAIIRKYQKTIFDKRRLQKELEFISQATIISAPSQLICNETSKLIDISDCIIYPNPIPSKKFGEKTIDYLFLGKFNYLKGAHIITKLSKFINIHVFSPNKPNNNRLNWIDPSTNSKEEVLSKSKYVIIPSLFESFSLVLYEALSNGCKIICSKSIPIPNKLIHCKTITQSELTLSKFLKAIDKAKETSNYFDYNILYKDYFSIINSSLMKIILTKVPNKSCRRRIKFKYFLEFVYMNTFTKKFKKLLRDPKKFFFDSMFHRHLVHFFKHKISHDNKYIELKEKDPKMQENILNKQESHIKNKEIISNNDNISTKNEIIKLSNTSYFEITSNFLSEEINVQFNDLKKSSLSRDNILIIDDRSNNINFILKNIKNFNDEGVTQFKEKNLRIISYSNKKIKNSAEQISSKFSVEMKDYFGNFKFILCNNPQSQYIEAIRYSSSKIRTICLVDNIKSLNFVTEQNTDCLIIDKELQQKVKLNIENFRRIEIIDFKQTSELFYALKKIMREFSSKDYNLFLPIYISEDSANYHISPEMYESYNIIIDIKFSNQIGKTFNEIIEKSSIKQLYIREELYFRYKNLIINAQQKNSYNKLLNIMLQDGNRIHAKY